MKRESNLFNGVDLKPLIDMLEPPQWWFQLWQEHTELMCEIAVTVISVLVLFLLAFRTFAWMLRTGRIAEVERRLNEWHLRRMQQKEKASR